MPQYLFFVIVLKFAQIKTLSQSLKEHDFNKSIGDL